MAGKPTQLKLRGDVKNEKPIYDHPDIYEMIMKELEGKRFEVIFKKEHIDVTANQWAYYFGGIIGGTCMRCAMFEGWTKDEIDLHFRKTLRSYTISRLINGKMTYEQGYDDIGRYSLDEMVLFIEDVLNYLATFEIIPLSPQDYNLKRYSS